MTVSVKDYGGQQVDLRSHPDESGEEIPENVSWPIELAWALSGKRFMQTVETTIGSNEYERVSVTTPATTAVIALALSARSTAGAVMTVYEDATVTGGTPVVMRNFNRNLPDTTLSTVLVNPSVSDPGDIIFPSVALGSTTGWGVTTDVAGDAAGAIRLKPNSTYIFEIESTASSNAVTMSIDLMEGI